MDIGKSITDQFSWINGKSLKFVIALIAIHLLLSFAILTIIMNFANSLFSVLGSQGLEALTNSLVAQVFIELIVQITAVVILFAIISVILWVYIADSTLKKFGSKTSSASLGKAFKIIIAEILFLIAVGIVFGIILTLVIVNALIGLLVGLIAIIPIIYYLIRASFYHLAIIDKDVGVIESFKESFRITKSRVGVTFLTLLIGSIIVLIIYMILQAVVGIFTQPLTNALFGQDITSKLLIIKPLIDLVSASSSSPLNLQLITQLILQGINGQISAALTSFFLTFSMIFLSSSIYTQLKAEKDKRGVKAKTA